MILYIWLNKLRRNKNYKITGTPFPHPPRSLDHHVHHLESEVHKVVGMLEEFDDLRDLDTEGQVVKDADAQVSHLQSCEANTRHCNAFFDNS